eukprot:CAMPEP_0118989170 /NCGR_PEP_ID=MMETSP1173-20130426/47489_1 /TAXON_ID=1034831 /ORGANISM="Rhizochromulina marina cf, Strain CCMP1243" /LENGTH=99 /DNA_ID=CAMNT_0006940141 /DNA_START=164 /DNA_END=463 /DNA_ORIENTATION=+
MTNLRFFLPSSSSSSCLGQDAKNSYIPTGGCTSSALHHHRGAPPSRTCPDRLAQDEDGLGLVVAWIRFQAVFPREVLREDLLHGYAERSCEGVALQEER